MPNHHNLRSRYVIIGLVFLACLSVAAVVVALIRGSSRESIERRIAALNARRALPAGKNAATIYSQLVATYVPAKNAGDPNLPPAAVGILIEASKMDSCWFPLLPGSQGDDDYERRFVAMKKWSRALTNAAARDIAGARIDAAVEKLHGVVRMGRHLRQQLSVGDFGLGIQIEASAWDTLCESVMLPGAPEEVLRIAEAMAGDLDNDFEQAFAPVAEALPVLIESFLAEQPILHRIEERWFEFGNLPRLEERIAEHYLRLLSLRRGVRVLVGLRRYCNANGRWPDRLDEIKTLVPTQALLDPFAEQTFAYRKVSDGEFLLYARGPNRTDENGSDHGKADDYRIWPQYDIKAP